MFDNIKKFFREIRIKSDFPNYETSRLQINTAECARRFDTTQLEKEVATIKEKTRHVASEKFSINSNALYANISALDKDIRRTQGYLTLYERDYKSELNDLHAQKDVLFKKKDHLITEMKSLQEARSRIQEYLQNDYDLLESAKDDIERWHAKSNRTPWLFGNGGRELPKHSMFGQSFGDLNGYKQDRQTAVSDIGNCKEEIAKIKSKQFRNKEHRVENKAATAKVFEHINATKSARQQMSELKNQGMKYFTIKEEMSAYLSSQANLKDRLYNLETERSEFIEQMKYRLGMYERETSIAEIMVLRTQFLEEFHALNNQELRRADHRKQWISEHA
ncbi:MAG: hypothetical protein QX191_06160 [Methylococcaceae bacterium]